MQWPYVFRCPACHTLSNFLLHCDKAIARCTLAPEQQPHRVIPRTHRAR